MKSLALIALLVTLVDANDSLDTQDIDFDYYSERSIVQPDKRMKRRLDHDYSSGYTYSDYSSGYSYSDYYYSDSTYYYDSACNCDSNYNGEVGYYSSDAYYGQFDYYYYDTTYDYSYTDYSPTYFYQSSYNSNQEVYSGFFGTYSTSYTYSYSYDFSSYSYYEDYTEPVADTKVAHQYVEITDVVFQMNAYVEAGTYNDYHYVWITNPSCDKINYVWNNKNGNKFAMRAVWDDDGITINHFEIDTAASPYDTTIYYVVYSQEGWIEYITGPSAEKYHARSFFTLPFEYTLYDCNVATNQTSTSTIAYSDILTQVVYQEDQYVGTTNVNDYHWVWLTSCDGINYFYNNKIGQQWRMKAYKNADGYVDWFNFDTDNIYFTWGDNYSYSKVTYNTDGSVLQITGPGQDSFTAHDSFTETFEYQAETCNTQGYSSRRRVLWGDIELPEEESAVGLSMSYYDNNYGGEYNDRQQTYECTCEESQNSFFIFLQHFFAWLSALFESMV